MSRVPSVAQGRPHVQACFDMHVSVRPARSQELDLCFLPPLTKLRDSCTGFATVMNSKLALDPMYGRNMSELLRGRGRRGERGGAERGSCTVLFLCRQRC